MLADQKTSFPMGKKGRHANISHSYGSSYHHEEQVALDMSNQLEDGNQFSTTDILICVTYDFLSSRLSIVVELPDKVQDLP